MHKSCIYKRPFLRIAGRASERTSTSNYRDTVTGFVDSRRAERTKRCLIAVTRISTEVVA